jgi:hypothetical protein
MRVNVKWSPGTAALAPECHAYQVLAAISQHLLSPKHRDRPCGYRRLLGLIFLVSVSLLLI